MQKNPEVIIVGIGQTSVGEHWNLSLKDLAVRAVLSARKDSGGLMPNAIYIGNALAASGSHQANLGALITEYAGLTGAEGITTEAADASGAAALRLAYTAIRSGMVDVAMAIGVEKFTDVLGSQAESLSAQMLDSDYESEAGLTPVSQAALLLRRYMFENKVPREALAGFAMVAHENGANNPHAMYQKPICLENYLEAGMISDPLNFFDVAPYADGAAAVVLTRRDLVPEDFFHPLICISGSSAIVDRLAIHDREDPLFLNAAAISSIQACEQAGIQKESVDFFEYSDISTLHAILSLEAASFAARGEGWKLGLDGSLKITGRLPGVVMGGFKARGHPIGASGIFQVVESVIQLRGEAGKNQIHGAKTGMVQCLGGLGATAVTHILQRLTC